NVSYSSNTITTQHRIQQRQRSSLLFNRQHSQHIKTDNNRRKRSFSPHIIESNDSINNFETTNQISHLNSRQNTLTNTFSATSISSQETTEPLSPTIRNSGIIYWIYFGIESVGNTSNLSTNSASNLPTPQMQRLINQYFPYETNPFEEINKLNENTMNFQIRCKIIHKSPIRYFGTSSKVFDAIVCDFIGEIKVVAFNDDVDRLYNSIIVNHTITIQNGKIQKANENYRTPYSIYEIRLTSVSLIEPYVNHNFKPNMRITKQQLIQIPQKIHGSSVDTEGVVIMDRGILTTTSETTGAHLRRRVIKIKDETSTIHVTIWNDKNNNLPENIMNKTIRIRNGKTNHYNAASTELKHRYHLIYTNTTIRFESLGTILQFIQTILYNCLHFLLSHSCQPQTLQPSQTNNKLDLNNYLVHLQAILTHTNLCNCIAPQTNITYQDFLKLLYKNLDGSYQWIFDLHVYNKNQQFRLYKSTKFGKNNPLLPISDFPLNKQSEQNHLVKNNNINYDDLLNHALISYTKNNIDLLIFSYNQKKWFLSKQDKTDLLELFTTNHFKPLTLANKYSFIDHKAHTTTSMTPIQTTEKYNHFTNFVLQIIKQKYNTNGYIQSCQQGTKNQSILFYNIGGSFRFCERLKRHHKSNQTCIIIDTFTHKYQIKCKDPDCRDFKPPWKDISFNEIKNLHQ
ncbi:unnamed protein product, partial [Rotaria sp. Silwood2]